MAQTSAAAAPLRLFFALWPDEALRAALAAITADLAAECGGRATARANLHVTLAFLGSVPRERVAAFETMAAALPREPFELQLDTLGYWRRSGIVWAGAARVPAALLRLAADMKHGLQALGWPVDERPFAAHATLVREARRGPANPALALPPWSVSDFVLVSSTQHAGGVHYAPLGRWRLRPA